MSLRDLVEDLRRPGGGWTVGLLTLGGMFAVATAEVVGVWPAPSWTATVLVFVLLVLHLMWGSAGYYPARM